MCGRLHFSEIQRFESFSHLRLTWKPRPSFNIPPSWPLPVVLDQPPEDCEEVYWGLVPSWSREGKPTGQNSCARAETIPDKPTWRSAWKKRHCLIAADSFYEWKEFAGKKYPYRIFIATGDPFAIAGLWEGWWDKTQPEAPGLYTCAVITMAPNELMAPIHDRMPLIIHPEDYQRWLDPNLPMEERQAMVRPFPADQMRAYPVSPALNRTGKGAAPDNDSLLKPVPPPEEQAAAETTARPLPTRPKKKPAGPAASHLQGELF